VWVDAQVHAHPEAFQESLQRLLPDLSDRSEIEVDLLSKLVLASGDVSLVPFVRLGNQALAASRTAFKWGCQVGGGCAHGEYGDRPNPTGSPGLSGANFD